MREISIIKDRILQYLDFKGVSKYECYQKTGITNGVFSQSSGISEDNVLKFLSYYRDINITWLFSGKGEMILNKSINLNTNPDINLDDNFSEKRCTPNDNFPQKINIAKEVHQGGIPLLPVEAAAGLLSGAGVQIMEYECEQYVIPSFKDAEFMIRINGNSMEPKYFSGDVVACQRLPMGTFFQWNCVYVIDSEQGILIKRIKKGPDKDHIILVSDNVAYEPFELHISQLNGLGRVIGLVRLES